MSDLVEVKRLDPTIRLDVRYASANNFLGYPVYPEARVFLLREVCESLCQVQELLRPHGYGLLVFDGYRPHSVTKIFWEQTPESKRHFVANPVKGSQHNRGAAVDLTLCDLATGEELPMPTPFDEFTEASYASAPCADRLRTAHRACLRLAMERAGFRVNRFEWWHFDHEVGAGAPLLDLSFAELSK